MADTNTVDIKATTTEVNTEVVDNSVDNQAQTDMRECLGAIDSAGDIALKAMELLEKLYIAKSDDERKGVIERSNRATTQLAASLGQLQLALKADPNGVIASELPSLAKQAHLTVIDKVDRTVIRDITRMLTGLAIHSMDEDLDSYSDAGCFYAGTPLGLDFGLEIGVRTGEGADLQRSGLVVGLRLDHLTGAKPAATLGFPKAKG